MTRIELQLFASLRAYVGGAPSVDVAIEPGQSVGDVLDRLAIPREQTRIIFVDHRRATLADPLRGNEKVGVFPAIGGG
jgi:molybdopterin synthase sulfur carrier subunit